MGSRSAARSTEKQSGGCGLVWVPLRAGLGRLLRHLLLGFPAAGCPLGSAARSSHLPVLPGWCGASWRCHMVCCQTSHRGNRQPLCPKRRPWTQSGPPQQLGSTEAGPIGLASSTAPQGQGPLRLHNPANETRQVRGPPSSSCRPARGAPGTNRYLSSGSRPPPRRAVIPKPASSPRPPC